MEEEKIVYKELSYKIIGVMYEVFNELGYGYQEKYYQNAAEKMLTDHKIVFRSQCPYILKFQGKIIGRFYIDLIIDSKIVIELKKGDRFSRKYFQQIYNYLKITGLKLAIIVNFTSDGVRYKRILNIDKLNKQYS